MRNGQRAVGDCRLLPAPYPLASPNAKSVEFWGKPNPAELEECAYESRTIS